MRMGEVAIGRTWNLLRFYKGFVSWWIFFSCDFRPSYLLFLVSCQQSISWPADHTLAEGLSQFCTDLLASSAASAHASLWLFHLITTGMHLLLKGDVIFRLKTISDVSTPLLCCFRPTQWNPTNRYLCKVLLWFYTVSLTAEFFNNLSQKPSAALDIITLSLTHSFIFFSKTDVSFNPATLPPTPPACWSISGHLSGRVIGVLVWKDRGVKSSKAKLPLKEWESVRLGLSPPNNTLFLSSCLDITKELLLI